MVQFSVDTNKAMLVVGVGYLAKRGVTATLIGVLMTLLVAPNLLLTTHIGMTLRLYQLQTISL